MFIFIYGEETYLSHLKLLEIINYYKKVNKNSVNLFHLDFEEDEVNAFIKAIELVSVFKSKKLIILKNSFLNSQISEALLSSLQKLKSARTDFLILFYEKEIINKNNNLFKFLKQRANCQEMKKLEGNYLKQWVNQEIKKYHLEIDKQGQELIIQFCGNDLWRLANEIKKLALYQKPGEKISKEEIRKIIVPIIRVDIFKTIDALAVKDKKKALSLFHHHFQKGDAPLYLLTMIIYQFRNLLLVKSLLEAQQRRGEIFNLSTIIKKTKLHPFVVSKTVQQSNQFSFEELKENYQRLLNLEIEIKTGKTEPTTGINSFLLSI